MAQVAIQKCKSKETVSRDLLAQMESLADSIKQRAYSLFQQRNGGFGSELDDWLRAERDLTWSPAAELVEQDGRYEAKIALPGLDAKEVQVSALPDALIIKADSKHSHEGKNGGVRFCEFSENQLFRRLDLPMPIDVDKVSASLDKGMLQVIAPKAAAQPVAVSASA